MAAKSLNEAILLALAVGPLCEITDRIKGELRDYMAHEIMRHDLKTEGSVPMTAMELFDLVFKDVSALKVRSE
jgi:hypothetical protein